MRRLVILIGLVLGLNIAYSEDEVLLYLKSGAIYEGVIAFSNQISITLNLDNGNRITISREGVIGVFDLSKTNTIRLKNGKKINGIIIDRVGNYVKIYSKRRIFNVKASNILSEGDEETEPKKKLAKETKEVNNMLKKTNKLKLITTSTNMKVSLESDDEDEKIIENNILSGGIRKKWKFSAFGILVRLNFTDYGNLGENVKEISPSSEVSVLDSGIGLYYKPYLFRVFKIDIGIYVAMDYFYGSVIDLYDSSGNVNGYLSTSYYNIIGGIWGYKPFGKLIRAGGGFNINLAIMEAAEKIVLNGSEKLMYINDITPGFDFYIGGEIKLPYNIIGEINVGYGLLYRSSGFFVDIKTGYRF